MNYFLKLFGWALLLALAAAVGAVSIFFNYRYGQAQGGTGVDGQLQGGVFALADAFKLCLPVLITTAWARGHRALPAIGAVSFAGLVVLSAWSAYAYTVLSRAELTGTHVAGAGRLAGLTAELKAIDVRLMALGELPPSGAIIAEIEGLRVDKRWYGTSGCKPVELTWDAARTFCATFASKNSMLARAVEAEALRAKRTTVAGHAAAANTPAATTEANPDLALIESLTGISAERAGAIRAAFLAAVLELVGAFAIALVWAVKPNGPPVPEAAGSAKRRREDGEVTEGLELWEVEPSTLVGSTSSPPAPRRPTAGGDDSRYLVGQISPPKRTQNIVTFPSQTTPPPGGEAGGVKLNEIRSSVGISQGAAVGQKSPPNGGATGLAPRIEELHLECPPDPQLKLHQDGGDKAHLDRYLSQFVTASKGSELSIAQVHQHYCQWCSQRGIAPVSKAAVGRRMAISPYDWRTRSGYRIYVDVKFAG